MSAILGIDPGLSGALAAIDGYSSAVLALEDLPVIRDRRLAWIDGAALRSRLLELVDRFGIATAVVERQSAMPRQGVASTFAIGTAFGSLLGVLQSASISIELVTPATWKRALGLLKCDKRASLDRARLLFPAAPLDRQKDHGRAEALLLAYWRVDRATDLLPGGGGNVTRGRKLTERQRRLLADAMASLLNQKDAPKRVTGRTSSGGVAVVTEGRKGRAKHGRRSGTDIKQMLGRAELGLCRPSSESEPDS